MLWFCDEDKNLKMTRWSLLEQHRHRTGQNGGKTAKRLKILCQGRKGGRWSLPPVRSMDILATTRRLFTLGSGLMKMIIILRQKDEQNWNAQLVYFWSFDYLDIRNLLQILFFWKTIRISVQDLRSSRELGEGRKQSWIVTGLIRCPIGSWKTMKETIRKTPGQCCHAVATMAQERIWTLWRGPSLAWNCTSKRWDIPWLWPTWRLFLAFCVFFSAYFRWGFQRKRERPLNSVNSIDSKSFQKPRSRR